MVALEHSRSAISRLIAKGSGAVLIFGGFFALLFTTSPKVPSTPYAFSGDPATLGGINVAHADAPACGGGDSGGDCAGDCGACGDSGDSCCGCGGCGCDGGDCGDSY